MRKSARLLAKFVGVVAVAALLMGLVSLPPGIGRSPYLSALADLATGQVVQAASTCSNRTCAASGTRCVHLNGSHTDCGVGDFCRTHVCL
jgi:hypothetical protein